MDGLRKFIEVDNREAVNVGGLRQGTNSVKVVKPRFTADLPEAVCGRIDLEGRRSGLKPRLHRHNSCGGRALDSAEME